MTTTEEHRNRIRDAFDAMPRKDWNMLYVAECSLHEQRPGKIENITTMDGMVPLCVTIESIPRSDGAFDTVWIECASKAELRRGYEPGIWVTGPYLRPAMSLARYAARHHRTTALL